MKLVTYTLPSAINYGFEGMKYREPFDDAHNGVLNLFDSYKTPGQGACYLPIRWSAAVLNSMRKMLAIDPELRFSKVYEKYGKLYIEFAASKKEFAVELMDLVYAAQNRVDNITHELVDRYLANYKHDTKDKKWLLIRRVLYIAP